MSDSAPPIRSFGADDLLACPICGGVMSLIRRSPDSELGDLYERQQFECRSCKHEVERSVNFGGQAHGAS